MKNLLSFLMIASLISLPVYAQDAQVVTQNEPAPFTGILLSIPAANQQRKDLLELDGLRLINTQLNSNSVSYQDIITHQKNQVDILMKRNDELVQSLGQSQSLNNYTKVGLFVSGILAVVLGAYAAKAAR